MASDSREIRIYEDKELTHSGEIISCPFKALCENYIGCDTNCAWYNVITDIDWEKSKTDKNGKITKQVFAEYACCQDHRIGKIVKEKE